MTLTEEYQQIYEIIEGCPGITSETIGERLGVKPAVVTRKIFNMAGHGFLTYGEGARHYAFRKAEPETGRGKPTKRERRQIDGETIRFGKWI